jgi:hypothetical protein
VLLVGALATANLGVDFGGTDFSFLEQAPLLAIVLALVALGTFVVRRFGPEATEKGRWALAFGAIAIVLGALEAAGSLADGDHPVLAGILVGAACAALGYAAARSLLVRTRRRLDVETATALPLYAEGAALLAAGLSVAFPPLAVLVVAGLAALLLGGRRRSGEKYAGLRILR